MYKVSGREAQRDKHPLLMTEPTLSLLRKNKASFGPEPESISPGAALLKERDHCHAWVPSPAEREGPSHCQTLGSFHRAACLASAGPRGRGPLPSDLFVWSYASSILGFSPIQPQKIKTSLLLCFLLTPSLCALRPPLLHLTIVAFSHRFIDLGNSPRARIYHALVMLATAQILRPSTTGPATMHT